MNAKKWSNAVPSAVQIVQSIEEKRISGKNVDSSIFDRLWDDGTGQIDVTHEHPCVRHFLFVCRVPEMQRAAHIRCPI